MATDITKEIIKNGTPVRIKNAGYQEAWVVEYRGPLGPKGERVYHIQVSKKPKLYTMALESQIEILDESE